MAASSPAKSTMTSLTMPGQTPSLSPSTKSSGSLSVDVKPSPQLLDHLLKKFDATSQGHASATSSPADLPPAVFRTRTFHSTQETYARKLRRMKRVIKETIFLNGTICDEVLRTEEKLARVQEERRFLLRKLLQYQSASDPNSSSTVKLEVQTPVSRPQKGFPQGSLPYDIPSSTEAPSKPKAVKRKSTASAGTPSAATLNSVAASGLPGTAVGLSGLGEPKKKQATSDSQVRPKKSKGANKKVIPPLMLDSLGRPIFPMALGDITLHSIGEIVPDRLSFHCADSIFPVGYCITRVFASLHKLDTKCLYTCKISDNNDGPLFEIAAEDSSDILFKSQSPIECHNLLIRAVDKSRGGNILPADGHGLDFFGLSHPVVQNLIQSCPGARKCARYKWVKFEINKQETNENVAVGTTDPTVSYEAFSVHLSACKYPTAPH